MPLGTSMLQRLKKIVASVSGWVQRRALLLRAYCKILQLWCWAHKLPLGVIYVVICLSFGLYIRLACSGGVLLLLLARRWVSQLPRVKRALADHAAASRVMDIHWAQDSDLIWVWRFIITCIALAGVTTLGVTLCTSKGVGITWTCLGMLPVGAVWLQRLIWVPLFLVGLSYFVYCAAIFHIVFFRNPVVPLGGKAGVWKALGGGFKALFATAVVVDLTSRSIIVEPNKVTNVYQRYSPLGRGYGLENNGTRAKLTLLQTTSIPMDPLELVDKHGNLTTAAIDQFLATHPKLVHKHTNTFQRWSLGLSY